MLSFCQRAYFSGEAIGRRNWNSRVFARCTGVQPMAAFIHNVPHVLTVAGSDSGAGAGIQADIKACAALGVYCSTVITAITAQNTVGVQSIHISPEEIVVKQLESVMSDMDVDVLKTGMMPSADIIRALCRMLKTYPVRAVVVDPVMVSTSGHKLASPDILDIVREELFPVTDVVTPNMLEASSLLGGKPVNTVSDMRMAAKAIHHLGPHYVLVKGGHLKDTKEIIDILFDGDTFHELTGKKVETRNTHGTGCTLASAIAAEIAKGTQIPLAVQAAKEYVQEALQRSARLCIGKGSQGPLNHLFKIADWEKKPAEKLFKPSCLFLYAVTDSNMNKKWSRSTSEAVRDAIDGGATIIQLREKESEPREFLKEAFSCLEVARKSGIPLLINDRLDIAMACDADGVHLGQSDVPVKHARSLLGPYKIIGASCKTPEQAKAAFEDGADYIGVGGVFPTTTKKEDLTIGLDGLKRVCQESPLPVVAIGGINAANVEQIMHARPSRLHGVAVVSALFDKSDIKKATAELHKILLDLSS